MAANQIPSGKAHVLHEALEFGAMLAHLVPDGATGDDFRRVIADHASRRALAKALEEIILPQQLPTATVDVGDGKSVNVVLLADAVDPAKTSQRTFDPGGQQDSFAPGLLG